MMPDILSMMVIGMALWVGLKVGGGWRQAAWVVLGCVVGAIGAAHIGMSDFGSALRSIAEIVSVVMVVGFVYKAFSEEMSRT